MPLVILLTLCMLTSWVDTRTNIKQIFQKIKNSEGFQFANKFCSYINSNRHFLILHRLNYFISYCEDNMFNGNLFPLTQALIGITVSYFLFRIIVKIIKFFKTAYYFRNFPCEPGSFLFGNLKTLDPNYPSFSIDRNVFLSRLTDLCSRLILENGYNDEISIVWLGWLPIISANDHRSIEPILSKGNFTKAAFYKFLPLREGLITSDTLKWKSRRKMVEPFFTTRQNKCFIITMDEIFNKTMKQIETLDFSQTIDLVHYIQSSSLDVICETALSIPSDEMLEEKKEGLKHVFEADNILMTRLFNPILWSDKIFKILPYSSSFHKLNSFTDLFMSKAIINKFDRDSNFSRKQKLITNQNNDLLDILMKNNNSGAIKIDKDGLIEEGFTLINAGHETISTALQWTLFALGNHSDIQERLYHEIMTVYDADEPITDLEKLNCMTYLDQCIKESMRLYPPVPLIARSLEENVKVGSRILPKDSIVSLFILGAHRNPKVYPNPKNYDPERFSPDNVTSIPKNAFLPFGAGPRSCIGYKFAMIEMKVFLIHLLRKFKISSLLKEDQISYTITLTLKPSTPLHFRLTPRTSR